VALLAVIQQPGIVGLAPGTAATRLSFVAVAVWWALFSLPLFRRVPEPPREVEADEPAARLDACTALRVSFTRLGETFRELRGSYSEAFKMLLAMLVYNDGIGTIIRMAAIYAAARDLDQGVVIGTILAIQFIGIPCSFAFGRLSTRFDARHLVLGGIGVYCVVTVLAFFMDHWTHFVLLGVLVALVQGGTQALSRSLFASLIPRHKSGEFFAFFGVFEKFAGILGPGLFSLVIAVTGSAQSAILSVIPFFLVGGWLLLRVDVAEGRRMAREVEAQVRIV
jgi:UMF1 family MFS transporter